MTTVVTFSIGLKVGEFSFASIKTPKEKRLEARLKWKKIKRGGKNKKFLFRQNAARELKAHREQLDEKGILEDQFNFLKAPNPKWLKVRAFVLKRDRFKCYCCGKVDRANHVHHILPRRYPGSSDATSNLITLCPKDHRWVDLEIWRRLTDTNRERNMSEAEIRRECVHVLEVRKNQRAI